MKKLKLYLIPIVCIILFGFSAIPVYAAISIPQQSDLIYIQDFANVLSDETEEYIINKNDTLYSATGAQIVIATVEYTDGYDIEDYAYEMFNTYQIGSDTKNNGVLLLLVINEDNYWVTVGSGLEDTLTGGVLKNMTLNYLEDDFAAGDYDGGAKSFFDAMYAELSNIYNLDSSAVNPGTNTDINPISPVDSGNSYDSVFSMIMRTVFSFVIILIIVIIILTILAASSRRRRYTNNSYFYTPVNRRPFYPFFMYRGPVNRPRPPMNDRGPNNYAPPGPTTRRSPSVSSPNSANRLFGGGSSHGSGFGRFGGGGGGGGRSFGGGGSRGGGAGRK